MSLNAWYPKSLIEALCQQQTFAPDAFTRNEIQRLINVLELHRPTASDGKHGDLRTPTCGCDAINDDPDGVPVQHPPTPGANE
jgi:hypothetical protein